MDKSDDSCMHFFSFSQVAHAGSNAAVPAYAAGHRLAAGSITPAASPPLSLPSPPLRLPLLGPAGVPLAGGQGTAARTSAAARQEGSNRHCHEQSRRPPPPLPREVLRASPNFGGTG